MLRKIAIIATHPVQYHVPWFQALSKQVDCQVKVYYGCDPGEQQQGVGFDVPFQWDIPMFENYQWEMLENRKQNPKLDGFFSSNVKNMGEILKRDRPDVIILTGWNSFPLLQALFWCIRLHIPRIVRGESNGMKQRRLWVKLIHRLLLSCYDAYLVIGKANLKFYAGYGIKENRFFLCPYFVDNDRLLEQVKQIENHRETLRARWEIPGDSICFIYVGKLNKKKRILDLLAALHIAVEKDRNLHLLVVGTGELMEAAKCRVTEQQLPVTFAGFLNQTEITKAYVAGNCLVLPSDYGETWGLVVNEAMVCGLPAIASDRVGCSLDLVENNVTGMVFPFSDIEALAERLIIMASDPRKTRSMGRAAQELVRKKYSVEKAVEGTLSAIDFCAG